MLNKGHLVCGRTPSDRRLWGQASDEFNVPRSAGVTAWHPTEHESVRRPQIGIDLMRAACQLLTGRGGHAI